MGPAWRVAMSGRTVNGNSVREHFHSFSVNGNSVRGRVMARSLLTATPSENPVNDNSVRGRVVARSLFSAGVPRLVLPTSLCSAASVRLRIRLRHLPLHFKRPEKDATCKPGPRQRGGLWCCAPVISILKIHAIATSIVPAQKPCPSNRSSMCPRGQIDVTGQLAAEDGAVSSPIWYIRLLFFWSRNASILLGKKFGRDRSLCRTGRRSS